MARCKNCDSSFGEDLQYHCKSCQSYVCFSCVVFMDGYGIQGTCTVCANVKDDTICERCRFCCEKSHIVTCGSCKIFCCSTCSYRKINGVMLCTDCYQKENCWRCKECNNIRNSLTSCNLCHKSVCNGCLIEFIDVKRSLWICLSCNSQTKKDYVTREEYDTMVESLMKEINQLKKLINK